MRVTGARQLADCFSVVCIHTITIIITHDHRSMADYGWSLKISRTCYDHPNSLYGCRTEHVTIFSRAKCFEHFKTVGTLQGTCRTLPEDLQLSQITTRIFPTFISIDNRDHKSAQCDWGFTWAFLLFGFTKAYNSTVSKRMTIYLCIMKRNLHLFKKSLTPTYFFS